MAIGKKERQLPKTLIGFNFSQFQDLLRSSGDESALISVSEARLIPAMKKASDELQLASVGRQHDELEMFAGRGEPSLARGFCDTGFLRRARRNIIVHGPAARQ